MLTSLRLWYWRRKAAQLAAYDGWPLQRIYAHYGRAALELAEHDPVMAEKIATHATRMKKTVADAGLPFRGVHLHGFLTGVANGAMNSMFTSGVVAVDGDGHHEPSMAIAACCTIAITAGMLDPREESTAP